MHRPARKSTGIALSLALLLAACGGGGGGGEEAGYTAFLAAAEYDGVVDTVGWVAFDTSDGVGMTGDMEGSYWPGYHLRQLYAFPLGSPPAGVRVLRAELRLWQGLVEGSPFTKHGDVVVDHVDYIPDPGLASYDGQNLSRSIGTLSTSPEIGLRTVDVTEAVRDDLAAGRPWSQFRLRFWQPIVLPLLDRVNDYVCFTTAEGFPGGDLPTLVIFYE